MNTTLFSAGGIGTLAYGTPLKEQMSAVVLLYPALSFVKSEMPRIAAAMQAPVLPLADGSDTIGGIRLQGVFWFREGPA